MPLLERGRAALRREWARMFIAALVALTPATAAPAVGAETVDASLADAHAQLQAWRFGEAVRLADKGASLTLGGVEWRLENGRVWLQEPTADELVTGLVFEGKGTVHLAVGDRFELEQLRRFAGEPGLQGIEEPFDLLVLRTSHPQLLSGLVTPVVRPVAANKLARERHEHWLRVHRHDADARVVRGLANPADLYVRADVRTRAQGWLTFEIDARRREDVHLYKFESRAISPTAPASTLVEHWLSLASPGASEGGVPSPTVDVTHVELSAELLGLGKDAGVGETATHTLAGEFTATLELRALRHGDRALQFYLTPWAEVTSVTDSAGNDLAFVRDHIGARSRALDKRLYDSSLLVLLPAPVEKDDCRRLTFRYRLEIANFVRGRSWYPTADSRETGPTDLHTAEVRVTTRDDYDIRAMGDLVDETVQGKRRHSVWRVDLPVKMVTFVVAQRMREQVHGGDTGPKVVVFGPPVGSNSDQKLSRLGADVLASTLFFQDLFAERLSADELYATLIQAFHGQAFHGFLHVSDAAAFRGQSGATELFLAHEVAHQWWGHLVGWQTYRDQWLSEAIAQYSAMLFVRATHEKGAKLFDEIRQVYAAEATGSLKSKFSGFSRPGIAALNKQAMRRIGPIGHGTRSAVAEAPSAYFSQTYHKGALVLDMLRTQLAFLPGGEALFVEILRDFVASHRGEFPSTEDFQDVVERRAGGDWTWFFDQWIRTTEIPTYLWSHSLTEDASGSTLELVVEQRDVGESFRMGVPVRLEFGDGSTEDRLAEIAGAQSRITWALERRPRKVIFNPDQAILSRVKRR